MALVGQQYTIYKCKWCGKHLLEPREGRKLRADKKFCNVNCRVKYHHWVKAQQAKYDACFKAFSDLQAYLGFEETRDLAVNMFAALRGNIDLRLKEHGIELKGVR